MSRFVTIALAQNDCVLGDVDHNLTRVEDFVRQAADGGADIVCLPELGTTGYRQDLLGERLHTLAEEQDGPSSQRIGKLAAELGLYVILPLIERGTMPGVVFNSVVLINRQGKVVGNYRKNHAYAAEGHYFAAGNQMPVFDTDFGRIGIMICYDLGLPEVARILTLQGAEIIIPCRALENRLFLAAVNRVGTEGDTLVMHGKSKIVGPRGETLAEGKRFEEDLVMATVDLDDVVKARVEVPYLKSRKPTTYALITRVE